MVSLFGVIALVAAPGTACSCSIGRRLWISSQIIRCFSDLSRKVFGFSIKLNYFIIRKSNKDLPELSK
jgi:hypothetical protein